MRKQTRTFTFPNGGHSVRKLCESLKELGDTRVALCVENTQNQYDEEYTQEVSFVETFTQYDHGQFNARKLAEKLKTLGTRFRLVETSPKYFELKFDTDFDDIKAYPEFYGVL